VPKYCRPCREHEQAQWYETSASACGHTVRARRDWAYPPRYCSTCKGAKSRLWSIAERKTVGEIYGDRVWDSERRRWATERVGNRLWDVNKRRYTRELYGNRVWNLETGRWAGEWVGNRFWDYDQRAFTKERY
jgi:hypothetical protein